MTWRGNGGYMYHCDYKCVPDTKAIIQQMCDLDAKIILSIYYQVYIMDHGSRH